MLTDSNEDSLLARIEESRGEEGMVPRYTSRVPIKAFMHTHHKKKKTVYMHKFRVEICSRALHRCSITLGGFTVFFFFFYYKEKLFRTKKNITGDQSLAEKTFL